MTSTASTDRNRAFLDRIDAEVPTEVDVHLILGNYTAHKTPLIQRWLVRHPGFRLHFASANLMTGSCADSKQFRYSSNVEGGAAPLQHHTAHGAFARTCGGAHGHVVDAADQRPRLTDRFTLRLDGYRWSVGSCHSEILEPAFAADLPPPQRFFRFFRLAADRQRGEHCLRLPIRRSFRRRGGYPRSLDPRGEWARSSTAIPAISRLRCTMQPTGPAEPRRRQTYRCGGARVASRARCFSRKRATVPGLIEQVGEQVVRLLAFASSSAGGQSNHQSRIL